MAPTPRIPPELTKGPFTVDDARRHGVTRAQLLGASWRRLGGGYYAFHAIARDPEVVLAAALRRLPRNAVFSGRTAAWLHGLDLLPCEPIEVTLPLRCPTSRLVGVAVRLSTVDVGEVVMRRGRPATSVVRTVADLGRRLPLVEGVAALDMALHRRLLKLVALRSWASAHPRYRGVARLRKATVLAEPATESVMETRLRLLLVLAGLPRPRAQVSLRDDFGLFLARADLYYPAARLAIEYDGATHRESLAADNRRQNRMINAGYRLLRFTAGDVLDAPAAVVSVVRRALATRM